MNENPTDAEGQYFLGRHYLHTGWTEKAEYWLLRAAEQGNGHACLELETFYEKRGDMAKSEYWHERAGEAYAYTARNRTYSSSPKNNRLVLIIIAFITALLTILIRLYSER